MLILASPPVNEYSVTIGEFSEKKALAAFRNPAAHDPQIRGLCGML
jgi:hypothetical protein